MLPAAQSPRPGVDVPAGNFRFDGGAATFVGTGVLGFLITVCTLGICYPFALVLMERWRAKHTYIDGRQTRFTGAAVGLFGRWCLWLLLMIVTLGIYSFWLIPRLTRWRVEHQALQPDEAAGRFKFDGGAATFVGTALLGALITVLTFGICYPFAVVLGQRWECKHTTINGRRLRFAGSAVGLFGRWCLWLLLMIVTLGIYSFWVIPRLTRWKVQQRTYA